MDTYIMSQFMPKDFDPNIDYTSYQVLIKKLWEDMNIQSKIKDKTQNAEEVNFMDGPPFVTGTPHWGHLTIGSMKSSMLNFLQSNGKKCQNRIGYDCHGVPIEAIVNTILNVKSSDDLKKIGIEQFNACCKETITKFEGDWQPIYEKLGRFADFSNPYKTLDKNFMESVWWAFKTLYEKNLVYRKYKVSYYSYPLQSPLSNFEVQQGYKTKTTKSVYVKFPVKNQEKTYFVAWTTTPWTLVANCALCINSELEYEYIQSENGEIYIIGMGTAPNADIKGVQIKKCLGSELVGLEYYRPFNFITNDCGKVVADSFVLTSQGTGTSIVHLSPAFGEDDNRVCLDSNLITYDTLKDYCPLDENCNYTQNITDFSGLNVFDAEPKIISHLKSAKLLVKIQQIQHEYPYCYRTDTPLINRTIDAIYIKVTDIKDQLLEANSKITWTPKNAGTGRFNSWLENCRDWCVSRTRYFGTPIPLWVSPSGKIKVIGSIAELKELCKLETEITDLHPEFINALTFELDGEIYERVPDVFDCWFESGCVPYGQIHYPFDNSGYFDSKEFLSDFIIEGQDQTRGWFYTLLVLSTALLGKPAYSHVNVVGVVLDESGEKLSKKKKNYVDSNLAIDEFGADTLRLYVLGSPLTKCEPLRFKTQDIIDLKQVIIQYINCAKFYVEHATNLFKTENVLPKLDSTYNNFLDKWIKETVDNLAFTVRKSMFEYNFSCVRTIIDFVEDLANCYVKLNRDRLKGKLGLDEWVESLSVLYYALVQYAKILAPFAPFLAEYVYQHISNLDESNPESVMLINFPITEEKNEYTSTFNLMKRILKIVRSERFKTKTHSSLKTPIVLCSILMNSQKDLTELESLIILIQSELNCLEFKFGRFDVETELKIELVLSEIGKKYKKDAQKIKQKCAELSQAEIKSAQENNYLEFSIGDIEYKLLENEFTIKVEPKKSENDKLVSVIDSELMCRLDFTFNDQIIHRSIANALVTDVQRQRKEMGLRPWNKIVLQIISDEKLVLNSDLLTLIEKRIENKVDYLGNFNFNESGNSNKIKKYFYEDFNIEIDYHIQVLNWN